MTIAWPGFTAEWGAPESLRVAVEGQPASSEIVWRSLDDLYLGQPVVLGRGPAITTAALKPGETMVEVTLQSGGQSLARDSKTVSVRYRESWNMTLESHVPYPDGTVGDVWVDGPVAFVARRQAGGISIVDLGAPAMEVGRFDAEGLFTQDVKAAHGIAYVTDESDGPLHPFSVTLLDITDPAAPQVVATVPQLEVFAVHNLWIEGDLLSLAPLGGEIPLYDVSDPTDPTALGTVTAPDGAAHDVHTRGGLLFGSHLPGGLTIASVADPANPVILSRVIYPGAFTHSSWLSADGRYLYVADEVVNAPIRIFDVSNPAAPILVSAYQPRVGSVPHNFQVRDDRFAYLAHYKHGVEVVDVSDPAAPRLVGFYDTHTGPDVEPPGALRPAHEQSPFEGVWGVHWTDDGRLVASDMNRGLFVFRFSP